MRNIYVQKLTIFIAVFFFMTANLYSQNKKHYNLFSTGDNSIMINNTELNKAVSDAVILNINKEELASLSESKYPEISIDIPYTNSTSAKVNLKRFDLLKPNAKIVARTANGNEEVKIEDLAVSYTGQVEGLSNSLVSVTFTKDNITGLMVTQTDNYILGAINDNYGHRTDNFILYKEGDMKVKSNFHCDADDIMTSEQIENMHRTIEQQLTDASSTDLYVAEIALELDFATYNVYQSSIENTTNYALALMAASSAIYNKEVNVRFVIPYVRVWTVPDPYTGTNSNTLLNQFRAEWNANQQSVQRTLAHFITRRGGGLGGIAFLNVLCSGSNGYGLSGTDGPILPLPTYSWDVMVVSHELGHNFGSSHTFSCNWPGGPIDSCYQTEGGCYNGPVIPIVGTIMSYCHLNGGISIVQGFGPLPRALIRGRAENAACMYVSQRPLHLGYPNGGETYQTGNNLQIYWGTSLTGNVNLELSLDNGTSWQTIQNNVPASDKQLVWPIPTMASVTQAKLRILEASNPSVGDTTDATFRISLAYAPFNITSPPTGTRIFVNSASTETQKFEWQRAGTHPSLRYKFKIKKLGANPTEYTVDSDNNGTDSTASVRKSQLDSIADLMGTVGDSVRCTWKAYAYNGIDSVNSSNVFQVTIIRSTVGIAVINSSVPDKFSLGNNYPNPFNPTTNIKFDISKSTFAVLKIYDSRGREVNTLVNEKLQPGSYEYNFNAVNLPSGAYFYRLSTDDFTDTKRMILVK